MTPTIPTLDFANIRKSCPNAFAALINWFCQGKHFQLGAPTIDSPDETGAGWGPYVNAGVGRLEVGDFRDQYTLNIRDLYDFFDQAGIITAITPISENPVEYFWRVNLSNIKPGPCGTHPTRAAAEAAAFTAGFAKLEEMLRIATVDKCP